MISHPVRVSLLCAAAISLAALLSAQATNSQITGSVSDASGASVVGASLMARNVDTGVDYSAQSNNSGIYTIPLVPPGNYRLEVTMAQFRPISRSGIRINVNETAKIDFVLELGSVTETVSVNAAAPIVDTGSGAVSTIVDNRKITQLPLNGRNIYSLNALVPGAAPDNSGRIRFNGVRVRGNEVLVDGVSQVPPETRADPVQPPPVDSVQEFKVATSGYSAEFGSAAGGLVNVATKAGTNELHGALWEFLRNDKLNTRNYFAPVNQKKPVLRQNQYGAAIGGPVILPKLYNGRNRTFFFTDFEITSVRSQAVFNVNVPTVAMRNGDLSQYVGRIIGTDALGNSVAQGQVFDPVTTGTVNGRLTRSPFPGNAIPINRISPVALRLLNYYPSPSNSSLTQNLQNSTSTGNDIYRYDIRVDENISTTNRVFARWSNYTSNPLSAVAFRGAPGDIQSNQGRQRSLAASWISTISPSIFNELRGSFLQAKTDNIPYLGGQNIAGTLGIPNITNNAGLPAIDISSLQQLGSGASGTYLKDNQRVFSALDNVSLLRGRHNLKVGAEVRVYRMKNFQPSYYNGYFSFRAAETSLPGQLSSSTGNAFGSFLLGLADQTQYTVKDPGQLVNNESYGVYVQDDWKISKRLTLNLGLRYDLNTRLQDKRGFSSTFDLTAGRVLAGAAQPLPPLDRTNFAPRFGLAYDVFGDQKTVIRGGFGIFYSPIVGGGGNPLNGVSKFPFEFTSIAQSRDAGITPVTTLGAGPVILPQFSLTDPNLGFGGNVQVQSPNTAPYVEQWNFGVERSIANRLVLGASYVASGGRKLDTGRLNYINLNQVPFPVAQQAGRAQNTSSPVTANLRPYPNYNFVQALNPRYGNSNYNSLQLKAEQRLSGGISYLVSFTWAKYIDNGSETYNFLGGSWPADVYNLGLERAVSTAAVPRRLVASYVWDLPFGAGRRFSLTGWANAFAGGWQLSGICTAQDGQPFDVEQSTNTTATYTLLQRPNVSGNPNLPTGQQTVKRFFDTSVFSAATPLSVGSSPRNPLRGPALVNFDAALHKQWFFRESRDVEFRLESFNFTNTPPLQLLTRATYNPALPLSSQSFGQITSAGDGRILQLALKLHF